MSIYNDGVIYPWEIAIALALTVLLIWFAVRTTHRAERRFQRDHALSHPVTEMHQSDAEAGE